MLDWQSDSVTYRGSGSYRFTAEQRGALILACDVEIISVVRQPYESLKSVPPNSHYGFAVIFYGSTPIKRVDLEFPATRIFHTTNLLGFNAVQNELLARRNAENVKVHFDGLTPAVRRAFFLEIEDPPGVLLPGMPETVVKVKVPPGSQFGIVARWLAIPEAEFTNVAFEASDGSDGLDEFGRPRVNSPDDPFAGNPPESPENPDSDPRDYVDGPLGPGQGVIFEVDAVVDPGGCSPGVTIRQGPFGPFFGVGRPVAVEKGGPVPACPGAGFGFRILFESGFRTTFFAEGAGVYSGTIVNQVVV